MTRILLTLATLLLPSVALADDGTGVPGYLVEWLLLTLSPIVVALASWAMAEAIRYLRSQTKDARWLAAIDRADVAISTSVGATWQTFVERLKRESSDGKLTADQAREALLRTLEGSRAVLGPPGLDMLRQVLGADEAALDRWLIEAIEAKVATAKAASAAPAVLTVADLPAAKPTKPTPILPAALVLLLVASLLGGCAPSLAHSAATTPDATVAAVGSPDGLERCERLSRAEFWLRVGTVGSAALAGGSGLSTIPADEDAAPVLATTAAGFGVAAVVLESERAVLAARYVEECQ